MPRTVAAQADCDNCPRIVVPAFPASHRPGCGAMISLHGRFPCAAVLSAYVTLTHAGIHLDRDFHWIHDRRAYSRALGWRHDLLFGGAAQWCWRLCGPVARVASVKMTETNIPAGPLALHGRLSRAVRYCSRP